MRDDLVQSSFGRKERLDVISRHLVRLPFVYSTPIVIGNLSADDQTVLGNGTGTLMQIRERKFVVTNDHVLRKYEELRAEDERTAFQIGTRPFEPEARLIDRDFKLDLCVFDADGLPLDERDESTDLPQREFYVFDDDRWPPRVAVVDDVCVFGGFPGGMRSQNGFEVTSRTFSVAATPVTGSFAQYFSMNIDRSHWQVATGQDDADAIDYRDWGGMSGGPVFIDGKGILSPILAGIIFEHVPTEGCEQLKAAHLALIGNEGRISRGGLY